MNKKYTIVYKPYVLGEPEMTVSLKFDFTTSALRLERKFGETTAEACERLLESEIDSWIAEFKSHGKNVTREAILHNLYAWADDSKSRFRDEKNGYHLFTPCSASIVPT